MPPLQINARLRQMQEEIQTIKSQAVRRGFRTKTYMLFQALEGGN